MRKSSSRRSLEYCGLPICTGAVSNINDVINYTFFLMHGDWLCVNLNLGTHDRY